MEFRLAKKSDAKRLLEIYKPYVEKKLPLLLSMKSQRLQNLKSELKKNRKSLSLYCGD